MIVDNETDRFSPMVLIHFVPNLMAVILLMVNPVLMMVSILSLLLDPVVVLDLVDLVVVAFDLDRLNQHYYYYSYLNLENDLVSFLLMKNQSMLNHHYLIDYYYYY